MEAKTREFQESVFINTLSAYGKMIINNSDCLLSTPETMSQNFDLLVKKNKSEKTRFIVGVERLIIPLFPSLSNPQKIDKPIFSMKDEDINEYGGFDAYNCCGNNFIPVVCELFERYGKNEISVLGENTIFIFDENCENCFYIKVI